MGLPISIPVLVAILCAGGFVLISAGIVVSLLMRHRKRKLRYFDGNVNDENGLSNILLDVRASAEASKATTALPTMKSVSRRVSRKDFGTLRHSKIGPRRCPTVLQRKRPGRPRTSSLPNFAIIAPRIPSPTLSLPKRPSSIDGAEAPTVLSLPDTTQNRTPHYSTLPQSKWVAPRHIARASRDDVLQPEPLFHSRTRVVTARRIPSAHFYGYPSTERPRRSEKYGTRLDDHQGAKSFLSAQHIGDVPSSHLPAPPQPLPAPPQPPSLLRVRETQISRSRSPRSRSMESLISGTSSVLLQTTGPVTGRKRSATEVIYPNPHAKPSDDNGAVLLPSNSQKDGNATQNISFRPSHYTPMTIGPNVVAPTLAHGNKADVAAQRDQSSSHSFRVISAPISYRQSSSEPTTPEKKPRKSRDSPGRQRKPRTPPGPPVVLTPSPRRFNQPYVLKTDDRHLPLQLTSNIDPMPRDRHRTTPERHNRQEHHQPRPFVSHLPRSPRPEDRPPPMKPQRPFPITQEYRLPTPTDRGSPVPRGMTPNKPVPTRSPGLSAPRGPPPAGKLPPVPIPAASSSSRRAVPSEPSSPLTPAEAPTCGDLAARLRRMDSFCNVDESAPYFNLTGGTCSASSESIVPADSSSPADPASDATRFRLVARGSAFDPRISIPEEFAHSPSTFSSASSPPPADLTPSFSSSPPQAADWSSSGGTGRLARGLGLGLAGRFDPGPAGLSYSPASSPAPSPCPSPPPRSTLRRTMQFHLPAGVVVEDAPDQEQGKPAVDAQHRDLGLVSGALGAPPAREDARRGPLRGNGRADGAWPLDGSSSSSISQAERSGRGVLREDWV